MPERDMQQRGGITSRTTQKSRITSDNKRGCTFVAIEECFYNRKQRNLLDPEMQKQIWKRYLVELFADNRSVGKQSTENQNNLAILTTETILAIKSGLLQSNRSYYIIGFL